MRQPLYVRAAAVAVLLLIVILVPISAWLRHAEIPPPAELLAAAPDSLGVLMRDAHRLIASTLLALVLVITLIAWTGSGTYRCLRRPVTVLLAITLALALLGITAGSSRHAAVVLGHLFGGLLAAATAAWLVLVTIAPNSGVKPSLPALVAIAWIAVITVVLGGFAGAAGWPPAMILHIAGAIVLAGLVGYGLVRTGGRGWPALLLVAAALASGWWAGQARVDTVAATTHTELPCCCYWN
ncbi:MAG: hypothetical protein U5P41_02610 [Gammaproteobacteria bacterium]|nr:hypothetical protein [Gammaproteobacteria bacterium]